jgi:hypothetical protein
MAAGCGPSIPPYTVNVPPRLDDIRPPRSIVFVRDELPLGGLQRAIDRAVGDETAGKKRAHTLGRDVDITWRLRRKPIVLRGEPRGLAFEITLAGEIGAHGGPVRCHADDARITLRAEARPELRPNGDLGLEHFDWKPKTHADLRCEGIPMPVDKVVNVVVEPLARALSIGLSKIELPTAALVRKALDAMRPPRRFALGKDEDGCLDLAPDALVLSPMRGGGSALPLKLGVEVAPRLVVGKCPPSGAAAKQPRVLAKNVPLADHFTLQTAVAIPYAELTRIVKPGLVGKRFGSASQGVVVDDVEIGDTRGRTLVHLGVHGALDGDLYLWGTPTVLEDKGRYVLRIPDLEVAAESRSLLQRIGLALWEAVGGGLKGALKDKLHMDVTDKIKGAQKAMTGRKVLANGPPSVVLTTSLDKIRVGAAASRPGVMILMPVLAGSAEFAVE